MMPISHNKDFNNIPVVLEPKMCIYLSLLECILLTMHPSRNCRTENRFCFANVRSNFFGLGGKREGANDLIL